MKEYDYQAILATLQELIDGDLLIPEQDIENIKQAIDIVEIDSLNPHP